MAVFEKYLFCLNVLAKDRVMDADCMCDLAGEVNRLIAGIQGMLLLQSELHYRWPKRY